MEDPSSKIAFDRLDTDNYSTWCVRTKCLLISKGLWKPTQDVYEGELDEKALAVIGMTLTEQHLPTFSECANAKAAWDAFAALFKSKSQARRLQLKGELTAFHKESGETLVKYIARGKHLRAQLKAAGTDLQEDELCLSILNGLPASYETVATVLTTSDNQLSLEDLMSKLLVYESRSSAPSSDNKAYVARPSPSSSKSHGKGGAKQKTKETRKCHHCGKPGHLRKDCWQLQREEQQGAGGRHQGQRDRGQTFKGGQGNVACAAIHCDRGQPWILDSGASRHITHSSAVMHNLRPVNEDLTITFGNGTKASVENIGDVVLEVPGSDVATLTLMDVWHVPEAKMSLFSIDRAVQNGVDVTFSRDDGAGRYCLLEKDGQLLARATSQGGVFGMVAYTGETAMAAVEDPELWHRRFGHLGYDNLAKLAAGNLVTGMATTAAEFKTAGEQACGTCITSKQHKIPRPSSSSDTEKPLELVHTDVCGPMQVPSLGGSVYLATYLDDYSKLSVVKPVKRKSEVTGVTKEVINFFEKQSGYEVLTLRSDNGTEYVNKELEDYLKSKGIQHQTTARYTPEQNGAAERLNRTLMDRIRAMLGDSGLSKELWAEAACTANYIRNRSPAFGRDRTPWELFFGKKPDISNMRTFGAEAYALVPKELRRKLDDHSELGHFVGYPANTKGYRIALSSGKVVIASDVTFVEDKAPSGNPAPAPKEPTGPDRLEDILEEGEIPGQDEPADPDDPGDGAGTRRGGC